MVFIVVIIKATVLDLLMNIVNPSHAMRISGTILCNVPALYDRNVIGIHLELNEVFHVVLCTILVKNPDCVLSSSVWRMTIIITVHIHVGGAGRTKGVSLRRACEEGESPVVCPI